jgi:soluble lytic murein transglycosylase-like protein
MPQAVSAAPKRGVLREAEGREPVSRADVGMLALLAALLVADGPAIDAGSSAAPEDPAVTAAEAPERIRAYLESHNPLLSRREIDRIVGSVMRCSESYDLDPYLVASVLHTESTARPWAVSPKGAVGLMQVMPHMYALFDLAGNITTIESNVEAGCVILSDNIRRLGENDGILAYFWGARIRGGSYLQRVRQARAALREPLESRS